MREVGKESDKKEKNKQPTPGFSQPRSPYGHAHAAGSKQTRQGGRKKGGGEESVATARGMAYGPMDPRNREQADDTHTPFPLSIDVF